MGRTPSSRARPSSKPRLESGVALLAVVAVLGLAAVPGSGPGSLERDQLEVQDRLGLLRAAIFRFSMEHVDGASAVLPGQDGQDLVAQLTGRSRSDGSTTPPPHGGEDRWLGPYLRAIPVNPGNGLARVRVVQREGDGPLPTGEAGWVYVAETGRIASDLP